MAEYETHILYEEYANDYTGSDVVYDPVTKVTAWAHITILMEGSKRTNRTDVEVFWRKPGTPAKTKPDHIVHTKMKGEDVELCKEETGLRVLVNSHYTSPPPDPNAPPGRRKVADETVVIPNVFV